MMSNDRHSKVNAEELSRKWRIGLQTAKDTLQVTTQNGIRTAVHPMTRRLRVDHLDLHRPRLRGTWFCDTVAAKVKSKLGNACALIFTQGKFVKPIPMTSRKDAGKALVDFTDDVGIPERLIHDGATEFTGPGTDFAKNARRMRIKTHTTEAGRKNQNHAAEREIGLLSKRWRLNMTKKNVPKRLWDFGLVYEGEILSRMSRGRDRRCGYEEVFGETADISEWLDFEFYDLVWWWDRHDKPDSTDDPRRLARWLGVSHRVGSDLCYWLITEHGKIISKTSVEHVIQDDYLKPEIKARIDSFNERLGQALDDANFQVGGDLAFTGMKLDDIDFDDLNYGVRQDSGVTPTDEEYGDMLTEERPDAEDEKAIDEYINMEVVMNLGTDAERRGRVVKRARGIDDRPIGRAHSHTLFDTR